MKKQEVISLLCRVTEVFSYSSDGIMKEIEQAITELQLPTIEKTNRGLSTQHRQKISSSMRNNANAIKTTEKPARAMVWVKDATGALIQQPAPRKRNPMSQETKEKIANSMLGNKNGAKGI